MYIKELRDSHSLSKSFLDSRKKKDWEPQFKDKMSAWNLYCRGCTDSEISRALGITARQFENSKMEFRRFFAQMRIRRPQDIVKQKRPSLTEGHPLLTPNAIRMFALGGVKKIQIAQMVGVSDSAIIQYFNRHPEISQIYDNYGAMCDAKVICSMFDRATGNIQLKKTKFATHEGVITDKREYLEDQLPSVEAAMNWLVNRQKWKRSDSTSLSDNKGAILDTLEQLTKIDEEKLDALDSEFGGV